MSDARSLIACSVAFTRFLNLFRLVSRTPNLYGSHQEYSIIRAPGSGGMVGYFWRKHVVSAVAYRADLLLDPTSSTVFLWLHSIRTRRLPAAHGFQSSHAHGCR